MHVSSRGIRFEGHIRAIAWPGYGRWMARRGVPLPTNERPVDVVFDDSANWRKRPMSSRLPKAWKRRTQRHTSVAARNHGRPSRWSGRPIHRLWSWREVQEPPDCLVLATSQKNSLAQLIRMSLRITGKLKRCGGERFGRGLAQHRAEICRARGKGESHSTASR